LMLASVSASVVSGLFCSGGCSSGLRARARRYGSAVCLDAVGQALGGQSPEALDPEQVPAPPPARLLARAEAFLVAEKPPGVVCHASDFVGGKRRGAGAQETESPGLRFPLLQRVREANGGSYVNLIHRLDRGASGCVLCAPAEHPSATRALQEALGGAVKTYVCLTRGRGVAHGEDLFERGWFREDREIKDYRGRINSATTDFRFVARSPEGPLPLSPGLEEENGWSNLVCVRLLGLPAPHRSP